MENISKFNVQQLGPNTYDNTLLIKEFKSRVGNPVKISIGNPLSDTAIKSRSGNPRILMDFLREETYKLSRTPLDSFNYGYEFESRYKI